MTASTKRRCAGCSGVIDGRPNKRYCSGTCEDRAYNSRHGRVKRLKSPVKVTGDLGPVETLVEGANGVLISTVARLGYLGGPTSTVVDATYGEGSWWTRHRPGHLIGCDSDTGKARDAVADFTRLPFAGGSLANVTYDPPYISTGNRDTSTVDDLYDRFGLGELKGWRAIRQLIDDGLAECARVLAPGGHLLVKCMDYTESGRKVWNTFHVYDEATRLGLRLVDRFHHLTGGGPQPMTNLDGSPREQKHAREVTSMLMVFTKPKANA